MSFDIYTFTAAILCVSHLALAATAIIFCILLYRRSRSFGWLFLAVSFIEPLYRVVIRVAQGLPALWYRSSTVRPDGLRTQTIRFDFPTLFIFAVIGLFILYRRVKHETPST